MPLLSNPSRDPPTTSKPLRKSKYRTFGVWDLTFPARARDPWTFPMIAVYRYVIVDNCPIWVAKLISLASYVASFNFRIEMWLRARFDAIEEEMMETHRVIRGVDVDGEESVGDGFDWGLWKDFRLVGLGSALASRASWFPRDVQNWGEKYYQSL
jgi:hypothetical protein